MPNDSLSTPSLSNNSLRTLSVLVGNYPGVLARVSGLFARRSFNIHSLTVNTTEDPQTSRMTVVTQGDLRHLQQIIKQLNKLIEVIQIIDHTHDPVVEREAALVKMHATAENRSEILQTAQVFEARVASISPQAQTMVLECFGESSRIDAFLEGLSAFRILELVRSGKIALVRGAHKT